MIRNLDRRAEEEQREIERQERAVAEYRTQLGRPFEHESRLKDLSLKQAQLNACLDLDKHDAQIIDEHGESDTRRIRTETDQARTFWKRRFSARRDANVICFNTSHHGLRSFCPKSVPFSETAYHRGVSAQNSQLSGTC